jgi:hypothetical protein
MTTIITDADGKRFERTSTGLRPLDREPVAHATEPIEDAADPVAHATPEARSSWLPVDLDAVLEGDAADPPPEILLRADGQALLYRGRVHMIVGEPETGKGWLVLRACAERLMLGELVIYVDFEDTAAGIVGRLRALGVTDDRILEFFRYVRPDEPLAKVDPRTIAPGAALVVLDGVTEALSLFGFKLESNTDQAHLLALVARPFAETGAAVVLVDHVPKDREHRGRGAIGAQHKLAGTDVTYVVRAIRPFGRGLTGRSKLTVDKDRPGYIRAVSAGAKVVGEVAFESDAETGRMAVEVFPAEDEAGGFRPTALMERISRFLEGRELAVSGRAIREGVHGQTEAKLRALECLIAEHYVEVEEGPKRARLHRSVVPFRGGPLGWSQ